MKCVAVLPYLFSDFPACPIRRLVCMAANRHMWERELCANNFPKVSKDLPYLLKSALIILYSCLCDPT